jgi:sphinganine-1-phosphate aldolase
MQQRLTAANVEKLLEDLAEAIDEVRTAASSAEGKEKQGDMVALYGLGQTSVGPHVVAKLAETFLDVLYE